MAPSDKPTEEHLIFAHLHATTQVPHTKGTGMRAVHALFAAATVSVVLTAASPVSAESPSSTSSASSIAHWKQWSESEAAKIKAVPWKQIISTRQRCSSVVIAFRVVPTAASAVLDSPPAGTPFTVVEWLCKRVQRSSLGAAKIAARVFPGLPGSCANFQSNEIQICLGSYASGGTTYASVQMNNFGPPTLIGHLELGSVGSTCNQGTLIVNSATRTSPPGSSVGLASPVKSSPIRWSGTYWEYDSGTYNRDGSVCSTF